MCAPVVVGEDSVGSFEVGVGAGDLEDAVVGSRAHVHAFHSVVKFLQTSSTDLSSSGGTLNCCIFLYGGLDVETSDNEAHQNNEQGDDDAVSHNLKAPARHGAVLVQARTHVTAVAA